MPQLSKKSALDVYLRTPEVREYARQYAVTLAQFRRLNRSGNPANRFVALELSGINGILRADPVSHGLRRASPPKHKHFWAFRDQPYRDFMASVIKGNTRLRPGRRVPHP